MLVDFLKQRRFHAQQQCCACSRTGWPPTSGDAVGEQPAELQSGASRDNESDDSCGLDRNSYVFTCRWNTFCATWACGSCLIWCWSPLRYDSPRVDGWCSTLWREHRSAHADCQRSTRRAAAVRCKWSWIIIPPARPATACSLERATVEGCQCPSPFRYGGSAATRRACHAVSSAGCHHRRRCRPCDICGACSHLHQPSPSTFAANRHHRSPSAPAPPSQPLPDPPRDPASTGT